MVRTFAFNPSTQSFGDALPGSEYKVKQAEHLDYLVHPGQQIHKHSSDCNPSKKNTLPKSSLDSSFNYSISDASNSTSPPVRRSKPMQPAMIVEDTSTLFTIRSLLINGQRFYQPVDIKLDGVTTSLKRQLEPGGGNGHRPLGYTSSAEHFDNGPAKAALVAMRMAEERNRQQMQKRELSPAHENGDGSGQEQKYASSSNEYLFSNKSKQSNSHLMEEELPWARGNPQPRSGKRGSPAWQAGHYQQQAPPSFYSGHHIGYSPTIQQHPPLNLTNSYGSFYTDLSTHAAFLPAPNLAQFANTVEQKKKLEIEQHNYELQKQIEDNKRRKYLEKQREYEQDERERIRNEIYAQRQRSEVEAEQSRAAEKALMAERKAERLAAAQRATLEFINKEKQARQRAPLTEYKRSLSPSPRFGSPPQKDHKPEWWEKKDSWNERGNSPALLASKNNKDEPNNNDENFLFHNARDYTEQRRSNRRSIESASSRRSLSSHAASPTNNYELTNNYGSKRPDSRPIRPIARAQSHSRSSRLSYQSSIEAAAANNRLDNQI